MELTMTERCLLDVINELRFSRAEKMDLLWSYIPVLQKNRRPIFFKKLRLFMERIEFMEFVKEYAESRRRRKDPATIRRHWYGHKN